MRIDAVPFGSLTDRELDHWSMLQTGNERFRSPFFRPEYTQAIAALQSGVRIGRLIEGDETVGFFPFQVLSPHIGGPVGGKRSNYHGVIAAADVEWDRSLLLRGCGLHLWHFDHLLAEQQEFASCHLAVSGSPFLDLSGGFEAYERLRRAEGSNVCHRMRRQIHRLERDLGRLHFEAHVDDRDALHLLMRWKSAQYVRAGGRDKFADQALVALLTSLHGTRSPAFAGMLSVLYAGGRPIAAHFGIRSRTDWHYWFPAYDPEIRAASPGLILLFEMARSAPGLGMRTIDLGRGAEPYKARFASSQVAIAQGTATVPSFTAGFRRLRRTLAAVKRSFLIAGGRAG